MDPLNSNGDLEKILDDYEDRKFQARKAEQERRNRGATFTKDFEQFRDTVVQPVFERIGRLLASRGHGFEITREPYSQALNGTETDADIRFYVFPEEPQSPRVLKAGRPFLRVRAVKETQALVVSWRDGSSVETAVGTSPAPEATRGEYAFGGLAAEMISVHLTDLLGRVFGGLAARP